PAPDVPLLRDVPELGPQRPAVVRIAVQGEVAGRQGAARFRAPRREIAAALPPGSGRVLPVHVTDGVAAPAEARCLPAEVEPCLELRQRRRLAVADVVGDVRRAGGRPGALERGELKLDAA